MEDNKDMVTTTENVEETQEVIKEEKKEKVYTRAELNKIINAEREKLTLELQEKAKVERTEAEKLAKMDTEQKLNYELEQTRNERDGYKNQIHSLTLQNEATSYANEKGLPLGYIKDIDYAKETAESIKVKIDNLTELRQKDMNNLLSEKLKQQSPKAVDSTIKNEDPFIAGFKAYKKNK